jgi:hypothetical protein
MRQLLGLGIVVAFTAIAGCGSGNKAKSEKLAGELIAALNGLADSLNSGDKAGVEAALQKCQSLSLDAKKFKVTKSENDAIKAKFDSQLQAANTKMQAAIKTALTSGKWTPQDLMELGNRMKDVGQAMQP